MKSKYRMYKFSVATVFSAALVSTVLPACEQGEMYCQVATGDFMAKLKQTSKGDNCLAKDYVGLKFDHYLGVTKDRLKRGDAKNARMGVSISSALARWQAAEKRVWALEDYEKDCKTKDASVDTKPKKDFLKQPYFAIGKYEDYLPDGSDKCEIKELETAKFSLPALDAVPDCDDGEKGEKDDKKKKKDDKKKKKKDDEKKDDEKKDDEKKDDEKKDDEKKDDEKKDDEKKDDEELRAGGGEVDHSKPMDAVNISYTVKDVSVIVNPSMQGNRVEGVIEYTEGDCSATYEFTAIWPQISCKKTSDCDASLKIGSQLKAEGLKCIKDKGAKSGFCALK